jgi:hypothetical protein
MDLRLDILVGFESLLALHYFAHFVHQDSSRGVIVSSAVIDGSMLPFKERRLLTAGGLPSVEGLGENPSSLN